MAERRRVVHDYPWWADPRFPYDPKWGYVLTREAVEQIGREGLRVVNADQD